jgi:actin-like ATPase involved in cell morphogenesis
MGKGKTYTNKTNYRSAKYVINEEKIQVFDRNLVQEMQNKAKMTTKERGAEEIDNFLSTVIATGNDLEQNIELMEEAIQSACKRTFHHTHTHD